MPVIIGLVVLLASLCGAVAVALVCFGRWRRAAYARAGSGTLIAQTRRGPVEYAIGGRGPPVLLLHGGAGGWDHGLALGEDLTIPQEFTLLAPSRCGYLRTPLATGQTPADAADAMAALLDELGIAEAAVVGISGGGPTALQLALRHPDRVRALVMLVAVSRRFTMPRRSTQGIQGRIFFSNYGMWFLDLACWLVFVQVARWRLGLIARWFLKATETFDEQHIKQRAADVMKHPEQARWLRELIAYIFPLSLRKVGMNNDLEQFAEIDDYPIHRIKCPTLVIHGRHDGNVPLAHGTFVADTVPGAELYVVEGCGHLVWLSEHAGEMRARIMAFLNDACRAAR